MSLFVMTGAHGVGNVSTQLETKPAFMTPSINLALLKQPPSEGARVRSIAAVKEWREAQAKLEAICKEQGIPIPEMIC